MRFLLGREDEDGADFQNQGSGDAPGTRGPGLGWGFEGAEGHLPTPLLRKSGFVASQIKFWSLHCIQTIKTIFEFSSVFYYIWDCKS